MPKVRYDNITLDSELEMMYYDYLVKNNIRFMFELTFMIDFWKVQYFQ